MGFPLATRYLPLLNWNNGCPFNWKGFNKRARALYWNMLVVENSLLCIDNTTISIMFLLPMYPLRWWTLKIVRGVQVWFTHDARKVVANSVANSVANLGFEEEHLFVFPTTKYQGFLSFPRKKRASLNCIRCSHSRCAKIILNFLFKIISHANHRI